MSDIRKVAVLGTGVLGSQIAFQTAYSGFDVVAYDISEEALEQARARLAALVETYTNEVSGAAGGKAAGALKRIALLSDLGAAVADADLVIEAVPEVLSIKQALYENYLRGWAMGLEFGHHNPRAATQIVLEQFPALASTLKPDIATESMMQLAKVFRGPWETRQGWGSHDMAQPRVLQPG